MRPLALLLAIALLAGCASDDADEPADATPTPTPTGPTAPTSVAAQPTTHELRHNFTDPPATETVDLVAGVYKVVIEFTAATDGNLATCAGLDARIVVKDPTGAVAYDAQTGGSVATGTTCGDHIEESGERLAGGAWTVEFTGRGAADGRVRFEA